jgi:hypothetical protein
MLFDCLSNDRPGKKSDWWDYYRPFDSFADWDNAVFVELRKSSTVSLFVQEFDKMLTLAKPVIDRLA